MTGIGPRLREERERLELTQREFGQVGGVEPNAQGKYENGDRSPRADYLAAVSTIGVDVLYVVLGSRTPLAEQALSGGEEKVLETYRTLPTSGQAVLSNLANSLAEMAANYSARGTVQKKIRTRNTRD
ncbi:helix-turn-helix domain-containing protein [Pseudomonas sp. CFBP 8770]|uniref:helix-turn-helix domain-containing protein n=1 Tax=unclassified Pseudomonas TaxID=196821 RepID=UPI000F0534C2|nr:MULTISPECIES: helix-turn-helix domain-containing protein [unclassified Pseudomonas]MBD8474706.1 helix-turn-helix domain-containing protein [Pseudomonas sp. CFBP 8773]MBD8647835.1 helix-turn-helix domain-containing protein [Pseudomonas sp. CFBP 8770]MBD8682883.1 helix-turn-helix domain-containing protein [Pseudomonas sp. CFBP 13719]